MNIAFGLKLKLPVLTNLVPWQPPEQHSISSVCLCALTATSVFSFFSLSPPSFPLFFSSFFFLLPAGKHLGKKKKKKKKKKERGGKKK